MDPYSSSGEKFNIKTRKPYTITKQRERWTEEEHNSFLEALKLYGRAWQRIEEHIGTKTAVQIRSHAQKFFTKLEKEAVAKGVPTRQALDMEIPPPRPKRKPNYPYPRKTDSKNHPPKDNASQPTLVSSLQSGIQILDLERKPLPETTTHEQKQENAKTCEQVENEEAPCASLSSENENSIPRSVAGVFRDFINLDETNESYITTSDTRKHHQDGGIKYSSNTSLFEFPEGQNLDNTRGVHNYPRHVPVQVVDGNQGVTGAHQEMSLQESALEEVHNPNLSVNIASRSSSFQTIPTFHPPLFTPFSDNQENYRSFLHVSSTISSLIVSSLLQNPAAHAAASFAAKFWHPGNTEASSGDSSSREQLNSETPSMAAIAAATVAAATAWWAAHGLLPVCTPFYPPFSFGTPTDGNQARVAANNEQEKAPEKTESSSEDSEGKLNKEPNPDDDDDTLKGTTPVVEVHDSSNINGRKQVDRSSCGSNTTSSSEIETDALEKNIKEKEEVKGSADVANPAACNDYISRNIRGRSTINPNESWKEVSEEGRIAFQALFSRQVLPQSFSNRRGGGGGEKDENSELDLNMMSCCPSQQLLRGEKNVEDGLLTIGLGNVKLNVHHTGFKPYKRCSMEAKENSTSKAVGTSTQNDEKGAKRMRFEAEAST